MNFNILSKKWLAYLVLTVGIFLSCAAFFILRLNTCASQIETIHPLLGSIVGILITFLIAAIVRSAQVAKSQTRSLAKANEDLKKEIAERTSAEETKQKLEVALLQGQKLQAIGTLAGGIAHDFNNILYAIIGYVEIAREETRADTLVYKNLGKILEGAYRGQELISRILAFSRGQHHHYEVLHLTSTISAVLSLLIAAIPSSVIIQFNPAVNPRILGNQTQIHQVFVNLITNAVDAMDGEGIIAIQVEQISARDPFLLQFPEVQPKNYCKIEIRDTGHGMDPQTIKRIFEPFFTTKEVGKGTGLGLSIVHTLIKEHGGTIKVNSKLGNWTKFLILIPEYTD